MRLYYPTKIGQAVATIVCVLVLIGGRDLCSERGQKQFETEMRTDLATLDQGDPCTVKLLHSVDNQKVWNEAKKEIVYRRCLSLKWKDLFVGGPAEIHALRPSLPALFLMLLVIVLEGELIYFYWGQSKKELSTKGSILFGLIHLGLLSAAALCLIQFRRKWTVNWPEELLMNTPDYPTAWIWLELVLVVMALTYVVEIVYSRTMGSRIVFSTYDEKSYQVADQEQKNGYGRI